MSGSSSMTSRCFWVMGARRWLASHGVFHAFLRASSSSNVRGQSPLRRRESDRSARSLPPVRQPRAVVALVFCVADALHARTAIRARLSVATVRPSGRGRPSPCRARRLRPRRGGARSTPYRYTGIVASCRRAISSSREPVPQARGREARAVEDLVRSRRCRSPREVRIGERALQRVALARERLLELRGASR